MPSPIQISTPTPLLTRTDIVRLVDTFYARVRKDEILNPIFSDIAQVDWESHLPRMYDFWDSILNQTGAFKGNPLAKHAALVPVADMSLATFHRWIEIFQQTLDDLFEESVAKRVGATAEDMAHVIYSRIHGVPDPRFQ